MFTCKLLSTGLTRQTPTRSRFACKYAGLEAFVGLRELHSNVVIRSISWGKIPFDPNIRLCMYLSMTKFLGKSKT
ncbi:MAG: hypothetical protein HFJ09_10440 [Lachnospiraceae bacterium]|nr:hypothetical protein [Lachnospiraceae bacterium]